MVCVKNIFCLGYIFNNILIFSADKMSGTVQLVFSTNELKEEKVETVIVAAAEEFQVSEYHQTGTLQESTFSSSSSYNWNSLKTEDSESVPIYATSLLDPSFIEQEGILNEAKVGKDSSSLIQDISLLEERRNFNAPPETPSKTQ